MSATAINQVRIYQSVLPKELVKQRADDVVRLLALGLVRSLAKKRAAEITLEPGRAVATDPLIKEVRSCAGGLRNPTAT